MTPGSFLQPPNLQFGKKKKKQLACSHQKWALLFSKWTVFMPASSFIFPTLFSKSVFALQGMKAITVAWGYLKSQPEMSRCSLPHCQQRDTLRLPCRPSWKLNAAHHRVASKKGKYGFWSGLGSTDKFKEPRWGPSIRDQALSRSVRLLIQTTVIFTRDLPVSRGARIRRENRTERKCLQGIICRRDNYQLSSRRKGVT